MTNTVYRYLGYGTTDNTGTAKLEYAPNGDPLTHSYTGIGIGEVDVIASLDDEITESSLVSDTLPVFDCLFYDGGISGNYKEWGATSNLSVVRGDDYTTLTPSTSFSTMWVSLTDTELAVEFDINVKFTGPTNIMSFRKDTDSIVPFGQSYLGLSTDEWYHIKFVMDSTKIIPYVDGVALTDKSLSDTVNRFYFVADNINMDNIKFKNFKIYPI